MPPSTSNTCLTIACQQFESVKSHRGMPTRCHRLVVHQDDSKNAHRLWPHHNTMQVARNRDHLRSENRRQGMAKSLNILSTNPILQVQRRNSIGIKFSSLICEKPPTRERSQSHLSSIDRLLYISSSWFVMSCDVVCSLNWSKSLFLPYSHQNQPGSFLQNLVAFLQ